MNQQPDLSAHLLPDLTQKLRLPRALLNEKKREAALKPGTAFKPLVCHVNFITPRGQYRVKNKLGEYYRLKNKSRAIQVKVGIAGVRSCGRSTGIRLNHPDDLDRKTLTIKDNPIDSLRLQGLVRDIQQVFQERLLLKRVLSPTLILDIALGLCTHDDEDQYQLLSDRQGILTKSTKKPKVPTTVEAIKHYIEMKEGMLGCGLGQLSVNRYRQHGKILASFITQQYGKKMVLDALTPAIEYELLSFLKGKRGYLHNYAIKIMQFFKTILTYAHAHRWVDRNVLASMRLKKQVMEIKTLTLGDLQVMATCHFTESNLERVKDVFLFCCYTGMAYTDVASLTQVHIVEVEGVECILKNRNKSGQQFFVPLFPEALTILDKYADYKTSPEGQGRLLPVLNNATMNELLKEVGKRLKIQERLHTHLARKTFTLVVEERGFSLDLMATMMGHTETSMTQRHYRKRRNEPVLKAFKEIYKNGEIRKLAS